MVGRGYDFASLPLTHPVGCQVGLTLVTLAVTILTLEIGKADRG